MEEHDGLFGVLKDLAEGKSITLPTPDEIELHALFDRQRRAAREDRGMVDEKFHAAVASWLSKE